MMEEQVKFGQIAACALTPNHSLVSGIPCETVKCEIVIQLQITDGSRKAMGTTWQDVGVTAMPPTATPTSSAPVLA